MVDMLVVDVRFDMDEMTTIGLSVIVTPRPERVYST